MTERVAILLIDRAVIAARLKSNRRGSLVVCQERIEAEIPSTIDQQTDFGASAERIVEAVRRVDGINEGVHLIIPTGWCFSHTVELPPRRLNSPAAGYALEEFLPVPLEEVTCAFTRSNDQQALGLAVLTKPLKDLLLCLAASDVHVEHLTPDIVWATAIDTVAPDRPRGAMLCDTDHRILAVQSETSIAPEIVRSIRSPKATSNGDWLSEQVALTEAAVDVQPAVWQVLNFDTEADCATILRVATRGHPTLDLCTATLAPRGRFHKTVRTLARTATLLTMFLMLLIVHLHTQRSRYTEALAELRSQQQALYQGVFPGAAVPPGAAQRLASERIRLERLTRQHDPQRPTQRRCSADRLLPFTTLRQAAERTPADVRINLVEATVDHHQLSIRGQTGDHRDAERIAEAVNRIDGWSARPPRTSRLQTGGVEFAIRALGEDSSDQELTTDAR